MEDISGFNLLQALHFELQRKYICHGSNVDSLWRSFSPKQRERAFKAGAAEGVVLKHPNDRSLGRAHQVIPELNMRDIAGESADFFLDHLKHRAEKTLMQQYREGVNEQPGDHLFIMNSVRTDNPDFTEDYKKGFAIFTGEDQYGLSYTARSPPEYEDMMIGLSEVMRAGLCVSRGIGELILERQTYFLQSFSFLIDNILSIAAMSKETKKRAKKPEEVARAALSTLSLDAGSSKLSVEDILAAALDRKSSFEVYLDLCRTEPVFLAHTVKNWYFSKPEFVPDERGRRLPQATDKYINSVFFEVLHNAVIGCAIWNFLYHLLKILADNTNEPAHQDVILQEISNICQFEYDRIQKTFKRHVQTGTGSKHFKRLSNVFDSGIARVMPKAKSENLAKEDPQLHHILRLCQADTEASQAVTWINRLDEFHRGHPIEQDRMLDRELNAFGDLAATVDFIQSLNVSLPLPTSNATKGQTYVSRLKATIAELEPLKKDINLVEHTVPIDRLKEPGMAEKALNALDEYIIDKAGSRIGFFYQDLNEKCLLAVSQQAQEAVELVPAEVIFSSSVGTLEPEDSSSSSKQVDEIDRPNPSIYSITPRLLPSTETETDETPPIIFVVRPNTYEVFSTLFSKSKRQGSITWLAFGAAMTELEFSIVPRLGSVFTFSPPDDWEVQDLFTVHRPHRARIEGCYRLYFASRLRGLFGWSEENFDVAQT